MPLEQNQVGVNVFDQTGVASQQEHGADAPGAEALDTIGQFVVDIAGGHHRFFAFRSLPILDAFEDSPLAFVEDSAFAFLRLPTVAFSGLSTVAISRLLGDSNTHSKTSISWNSEDVFLPPLFQDLRGFSSFFWNLNQDELYITLG